MSVRPTNEGSNYPTLSSGIGYDSSANTGDIETPPDRLPDAGVEVPVELGTPALVQSKAAEGSWTVTLDSAPAAGNVLVLGGWKRSTGTLNTPTGWTALCDTIQIGAFFQDVMRAWYKVSDGTETTVTWTSSVGGEADHTTHLSEWSGVTSLADSDNATGTTGTSHTAGAVTPASAAAVIVGIFDQSGSDDPARTATPGAGYTELFEGTSILHPFENVIYQIADPASGSYSPSVTGDSVDWAGISAAFGSSGNGWFVASYVQDADDATYNEVTSAIDGVIVRAALDAPLRLATSTLKIGYGAAGSVTLDFVGANAADYSDGVTLDSQTFTATGSYTLDTVTFTLPDTTAYQFYQIEGPADCRIYTWELYESNDAAAVVQITAHLTDPTDAHDASAVSVLDTGDYFAGTNVEAVLAEIGAAGSGPDVELVTVAATGATETVDVSVARTYDLTLTADCTLTLTGAVNDEAWFVTLFLRQDGTGGWDVTWPGSVEWASGSAPVIDPTAAAVTVVTLGSLDGGTVWYGFPTGGGGLDVALTTVADAGATETVDVSVARTADLTLTEDCTISLTGAVDDEAWYLTLLLRQGGAGGWDVTWPAAVEWVGGSAPTLSGTAGDVDAITLFTVDGGTQWIGVFGGSGTGATALDDLTDVNITTPSEGETLAYRSGEWVNESLPTPSHWEIVVDDGGSGPAGVNVSEYVEMTTPDSTTSASLEDITGATTDITLVRESHVAAWMTCHVSAGAVCTLGLALNFDGTDHDVVDVHLTSTDEGSVTVLHRTDTALAPGTYTIKGRMQRVSGAGTPSVDRVDLFVMSMGQSGPVMITTDDESDFLYAEV